jgi:hypothetical protein
MMRKIRNIFGGLKPTLGMTEEYIVGLQSTLPTVSIYYSRILLGH